MWNKSFNNLLIIQIKKKNSDYNRPWTIVTWLNFTICINEEKKSMLVAVCCRKTHPVAEWMEVPSISGSKMSAADPVKSHRSSWPAALLEPPQRCSHQAVWHWWSGCLKSCFTSFTRTWWLRELIQYPLICRPRYLLLLHVNQCFKL